MLRSKTRRFKKALQNEKCKTEYYLSTFSNLSKSAQIFINSQLRQQGIKKTFWTEDEKALCLAMFKSSPKGYRFLQRIGICIALK